MENINKSEKLFTGFCKVENHINKLEYYCKDHLQLCCVACISVLKGKGNGQHSNCNICFIEDIIEEKRIKLEENIENLENLYKNLPNSINQIQKLYEEKNKEKENLKIKIQNLFTKLRSELNEREKELLLKVDKSYEEYTIASEELIQRSGNLPKNVKISLEARKEMITKKLDIQDKSILFINNCSDIEMNIKDINIINQIIEKAKIINTNIYFISDDDNNDNDISKKIKKFGKIICQKKIIDKRKEIEISIKELEEKEDNLKIQLIKKSNRLKREENDYLTIKNELENLENDRKIIFNNFIKKLSDYINKNISIEYFNNEKKLREYFKLDSERQKIEFHNKEEYFLSSVYNHINEYECIIVKNKPYFLLSEYINYCLEKHHYYDKLERDIKNKMIVLLLKLRFREGNNQIIENNRDNPFKLLLIKIMWIESNANYILNILELIYYGKELFNDNGNNLYNMIEEIINDEKINIKYIINERRNPEHTREVNECFYIILAAFCLSLSSEKIKLSESFNFENNKVEINLYCNILKKTYNILQSLNNDLILYLNEMYIIDELKEVIELQKLKVINIEKIETIRKYLRESSLIIQNNQPDKIGDLIVIFENIYDSLTPKEINKKKDYNYYNKYYDTLRYVFYKEINKISDMNYRCKILEKILKEKEIIKKSNDIFQILLKKYVSVKSGEKEFKKNLSFISKSDDEIINLIENYLVDNKKDYYFTLSETLLYFFEKKFYYLFK